MHVAVRFPPGTRERQKQLTYDLVSWLAGHPSTVIDAVTGIAVPRTGPVKPEIPAARDCFSDLALSEKLRTACQSRLDQKLGAGASLLLVEFETSSIKVGFPNGSPCGTAPICSGGQLRFDIPAKRIHACLVVAEPKMVQEARLSLGSLLDEKRGDDLRVVVIP